MSTDVTDESHSTGRSAWDAEAMSTAPTARDLLGLFPPGREPMATAPSWWADAGSTSGRRVRHPGHRRRRGRPAGSGTRVPQRVPQPMAPQRSGVRVEVVPVHGGSAGDGRSLHLDVAGGGEILTAIKAGAIPPGWCCTATPRPTRSSNWPSSTASDWSSSTTSTTSTGWNASCRRPTALPVR